MSFHPKMAYDATFHRSSRDADRAGRAVRVHAGEPRAVRRDRRRAIRRTAGGRRCCRRSIWCSTSRATSPANAMRYVAGLLGITPADVEDVVSYYTMFYTKPVGRFVLRCAARCRAR